MPSYIKNRAVAYGCLQELVVDQMTTRVCTPEWDITVTATMPQKGIEMKMEAGVVLGQQLAVQADRFLETIDESLNPGPGDQMIIREQEAVGVCYLCANRGHTSVDCPRLKSGVPQIEAERMGEWYQSTVNMQNLPRLYKIRKEPILDPRATVHQAAGAGLWHHNMKKKPPMKRNKKLRETMAT